MMQHDVAYSYFFQRSVQALAGKNPLWRTQRGFFGASLREVRDVIWGVISLQKTSSKAFFLSLPFTFLFLPFTADSLRLLAVPPHHGNAPLRARAWRRFCI